MFLLIGAIAVTGFYVGKRSTPNTICEKNVQYKELDSCSQQLRWAEGDIKSLKFEIDTLKQKNDSLERTVLSLQPEKGGKIHYRDDELKISFDYPKAWGLVTKEPFENQGYQIQFTFSGFSDNPLFMVATNPNIDPDGHGGYWGDAGSAIHDRKDIENFCQDKKKCSVFTNKNKVLIAQHLFIPDTAGGPETNTDSAQYYFYNPSAKHTSFVMSDVRIQSTDLTENISEEFEKIVQSINFID